jgi:CBS domain-containing protein
MYCPNCGYDNLPGSEECSHCLMDLTQLDRPIARDRIEQSLMEDHVSELQPPPPITILPSTAVHEAIQLLLDRQIGALLVVNEAGKLAGIFSERDLLYRIVGLEENYAQQPVERFMTPNPETVNEDHTLAFALHKMDIGGYRHLPVTRAGQPIGVISVRDMLRYITRLCKDC